MRRGDRAGSRRGEPHADRAVVSGFLLRGLRSRWRVNAVLLAAASLTVAAAVVSSVFAVSAEESVVRDLVAAAPPIVPRVPLPALAPAVRGLRLIAENDGRYEDYPKPLVPALLRQRPSDGRLSAFPHGTTMMQSVGGVTLTPVLGSQTTQFVWREGFCAHVRVVAGRCATGAHDAMISAKTAAVAGSDLLGRPLPGHPVTGLRIVGVYRPRAADDPFWFGGAYFQGHYTEDDGAEQFDYPDRTSLDAVLVTEAGFLQAPQVDAVHVTVDYPLDIDAADITGGELDAQVAAMRRAVRSTPFAVRTRVGSVVASARPQRVLAQQGARFVALQLIGLGLVVLFLLTRDVIEGRRREVALARLRGQSAFAVARFALAEPLAVLLAALPAGVVIGLLAGAVLDAVLLRPGTPVGLPPNALGAAGLTLAGGAAAVAVSTLQVANRPVLDQWSRVGRRRRPRPLLSLLVALGCLAGAGAVVAAEGRWAAAAPALVLVPALLVVAVAVAGVPLIVAVARRSVPRTRATSRFARFLAVRRVARERSAPRVAALLVVTLGLATFAAGGQSVLLNNRRARAEAELGAAAVVPVAYDGVHDPVAAVQRADPDGRWAAASASWSPDGGDSVTGDVLGLQPDRLRRFGLPVRGGMSPGALARAVAATTAPEIRITGTRLVATLDAADLRGSAPSVVRMVLVDADGNAVQPFAGPLRAGSHDYAAAVPCSRGCGFAGFTWDRPPAADGLLSGTVAVRGLAVVDGGRRHALDARLQDARAWRAATPVSEASDEVRVGADGVIDAFRTTSGYGGLQHSAAPRVLPVVSTPGGMVEHAPPGGFAVLDRFGDAQRIRRVATTPLLPVVLDAGVAVDVGAAERALPDLVDEADWSVRLSSAAPPDALQRLERAGLVLGTPVTLADREGRYARQAPALSFGLLLALAVVAAVLAVLATGVSAASAARTRAREAAAMRLIGVPAGSVLGAAVLEQVLLLGGAAVLALPAGIAGVLLVMPRLREFATATPVPQVFTPSIASVLLLVVVLVVAVAGTGALAAVAVQRSARPQRLREVDA